MTLMRPVAVTPDLVIEPTSKDGLLARVRIGKDVAELDRAELEELREVVDEALS